MTANDCHEERPVADISSYETNNEITEFEPENKDQLSDEGMTETSDPVTFQITSEGEDVTECRLENAFTCHCNVLFCSVATGDVDNKFFFFMM